MSDNILTQERLKELLSYDPETGIFVWVKSKKVAGCTRFDLRKKITINFKQYYAHRLAWLYMTGALSKDIDHIDRNPSNNQFANLRLATKSENQHNRVKQKNNKSGYKGVLYFARTGRWRANIFVNNTNMYLGFFNSALEANAAYLAAQKIYHPTFPGI